MKTIKFASILLCLLSTSLLNLLWANLHDISDGRWLRLGIEREGVYVVTAGDLQRLGITIPADKVNTIKIYGQSGRTMPTNIPNDLSMQEQDIIVNTNADGSLESIVFYSSGANGLYMGNRFNYNGKQVFVQRHYMNCMDTKNYYLLTYGKTIGKRATALHTPTGDNPIRPTSYKATIYHEYDKLMSQSPGSGVLWLGDNISDNILVDNLTNYNHTADVEYVISVAHTGNDVTPMTISQNKTQIKEISLPSVRNSGGQYASACIVSFYATVPPADILDNKSLLKFDYGGVAVYPYHNFYEIHYPSDMKPINNQITFFSNIVTFNEKTELVEYVVSNFTGTIYGFDVTDMSNPKLLNNISSTKSSFVFRRVEDSSFDSVRKYFISGSLQTPLLMEEISMLNLRNVNDDIYSNSDMIVISPAEFIESAKHYAEYRRKQSGLKVSVVPIDKIYAEFSYSRQDLAAIRNYLQYTYKNWSNPPKYVFLWGTGHYDYRQIEGYANYIPAYQAQNSNAIDIPDKSLITNIFVSAGLSSYTTDDFFVDVEKNATHQLEMAIGRLPISNNEQGYDYTNKLDLYENNSNTGNWRRNILIHADDGPTTNNDSGDGTSHTNAGEEIMKMIPNDLYKNKVYIVDYPTEYQTGGARLIPKASEELMKQLNLVGNTLYLYSGHGSRNTLTHEKTFTIDMLSQLNNSDKLFFFGAFSCEVGRFDNHTGTLSADIVLLPKSGGIASYAASRISTGPSNTAVASNLLRHLLDKDKNGQYNSIGEACRLAKYGDNSDEAYMYILIGDPSLVLAHPPLNVKLSELNGIKIGVASNDEPQNQSVGIEVKGLSQLNLKGNITDDANNIMSNFNGTVNITLTEPSMDATVVDPYGTAFKFIKNGATLSSSVYKVDNGQFEANIMVPGDISFSPNKSIIYMYASDSTKKFAKGMFDSIVINDIDTNVHSTSTGPTITIRMDSKLFKSGDVVARNPLLMVNIWDTTAINTTGLGIGHKIEARIDNSFSVIDLTNNFSPSFSDPNAGDIYQYLYGIEPGYHTITVRAWNVFNKYTETTVGFVIPTDNEEGILSAAFTPNPANYGDQLGIAIYYTVPPPINAEIQIFDATGTEIVNTNQTLTTNGYTLLDWKSLSSNAIVVPGTYYYYIRFTYDQTRTTYRRCEKFGGLGVISK